MGDELIVHAGFAVQKLDREQAMDTLNLLGEALHSSDEGARASTLYQ